MDDFHVADALEAIFSAARRSNKYIDETTPWLLAKDEDKRARLGTVLYNLLEYQNNCRSAQALYARYLGQDS